MIDVYGLAIAHTLVDTRSRAERERDALWFAGFGEVVTETIERLMAREDRLVPVPCKETALPAGAPLARCLPVD